MPDPTLCGNHDPCPACQLRREAEDTTPIRRPSIPCNTCAGVGFIPLSAAEIISRTVAEARQTYWPQFEQRIAQHKEQSHA